METKADFDPIWVSDDVSPEIAEFIQSARLVMLKMKDGEVIKRAIASGNSLVQGASSFVAQTINLVESKLGDLSPQDENVVAVHLAGTIVDYAAAEGDPEAKDKKRAVQSIAKDVMAMLQADQGQQAPPAQPAMPEQPMMPEQPQPLMSSAGG